MIENVDSIEALLHVSFGRGIEKLSATGQDPNFPSLVDQGEKICVAALKCFTGWIFYAQSELRDRPKELEHLRSVNEFALICLEHQVDDTMELVAEILENYPNFFEAKHLQLLWSTISGSWGLEILKNPDAETVSLARIIVAYGQILLESKVIYKEPENQHYQQVMCKCKSMLTLCTYRVGDFRLADLYFSFLARPSQVSRTCGSRG